MKAKGSLHGITEMRASISEWIKPERFIWFATLTFHRFVSLETAENTFHTFLVNFNRTIYGKRSRKGIDVFATREKQANGNRHYHVLFGDAGFCKIDHHQLDAVIAWHWSRLELTGKRFTGPKQTCDVRLMSYQDGCLHYITKALGHDMEGLDVVHVNVDGIRYKAKLSSRK